MVATPTGNTTLLRFNPMDSADAISMGATIPNTTTGLWINWLRSTPISTYPSIILWRLPLETREMVSARLVQNRVRLKPAATTHIPAIMITLLLEKYPTAAFASRHPVRVRDVRAMVARLYRPLQYPAMVRAKMIRQTVN